MIYAQHVIELIYLCIVLFTLVKLIRKRYDIEPHYVREGSLRSLIFDSLSISWRLRKQKLSVSLDLEFFSRYSSLMGLFVGAKYRSGFFNVQTRGLYRGKFLTHEVFYNVYEHTSLAFISLLRAVYLGDQLPFYKAPHSLVPEVDSLPISQEDTEIAMQKSGIPRGQPFVLLNPNCTALIEQRKWPLKNFSILINLMKEKYPNLTIGLVGAPHEFENNQIVIELSKHLDCVNLAGKINIDEFCALTTKAEVFITNDSGPAHMASIVGSKVWVLFGPETPRLFKPISPRARYFYANLGCSPCVSILNGKYTTCKDNQCMKLIEPKDVFEELIKDPDLSLFEQQYV